MKKDIFRQIAVIFSTLLMITINALASINVINGINPGQISDQFEIYFVPAGYVFSIWGIIYVAVIVFSIYQALPSNKENPVLRKVGWWFVASNFANAIWVFFWQYQLFYYTLAMMFLLLVSLIVIYMRLGIGVGKVTPKMRFMAHLPFSIYLGWITVATIANVSDVLYYAQWDGLGIPPKAWAVTMLVVGAVISELVAYNRRDVAFLAVMVWAFVGISQKFNAISPIFEAACVAALVVSIMGVLSILFRPKTVIN